MRERERISARCACGRVELQGEGAAIAVLSCYCDDCQEAAKRLEALPKAPKIASWDGGTELILLRRDRMQLVAGEELLLVHRLREDSDTGRYVASCCNSAMYLGFEKGPHWVSVFRARAVGPAPPVEMRVNTRYREQGKEAQQDGIPSYRTASWALVARLVSSKVAMIWAQARR